MYLNGLYTSDPSSHLVEAEQSSRSLTADQHFAIDGATPSLHWNCCGDYGWSFNILAPDLANRSRWSPPRNRVQLHVGIFLRMFVAGGWTWCQLACFPFLGIQMNRSIPSVWCEGSPLTPKQCSFFNQRLPTLNVLKYGNVMLPVFVLQRSAMSVNIVMGSVEMRSFSPCFPHSHVFQKTWRQSGNMTSWLFKLSLFNMRIRAAVSCMSPRCLCLHIL